MEHKFRSHVTQNTGSATEFIHMDVPLWGGVSEWVNAVMLRQCYRIAHKPIIR